MASSPSRSSPAARPTARPSDATASVSPTATTRLGDGEKTRNGALQAMKADYAALVATTETVAARLDAAIGRLDRALEA